MKRKQTQAVAPTDAELLDWLDGSLCTIRAYEATRAIEDNSVALRWNLYNYRIGQSYNAETVRQAIAKAMSVDVLPAMSLEAAEMVEVKGARLKDMEPYQQDAVLAWAVRKRNNFVRLACEALAAHRNMGDDHGAVDAGASA
jgi:hypothetical protein